MERSTLWSHFKAPVLHCWWLSSVAQQSVSWADDHIHFKCWKTCHFEKKKRFREQAPLLRKARKMDFCVFLPHITYQVERGRLKFRIIWINLPIIRRISPQLFEVTLLLTLFTVGWIEEMRTSPPTLKQQTWKVFFFMGQSSHMLPKPLYLSN